MNSIVETGNKCVKPYLVLLLSPEMKEFILQVKITPRVQIEKEHYNPFVFKLIITEHNHKPRRPRPSTPGLALTRRMI